MTALIDDADFEWLMIDASHLKVHPDATGIRGGKQARGLNTKIHLAVDAHDMPVRFFVTDATIADCAVAEKLISGWPNASNSSKEKSQSSSGI